MNEQEYTTIKSSPTKIIIVSLIALGIIGMSFAVSQGYFSNWRENPKGQENQEGITASTSPQIQNSSAKKPGDADGDGLYDWEEILWQTDVINPDTDGDGVTDGDEVKQNRNSLLAGPNDIIYDNSGLILPGSSDEEMSDVKKEFYSDFLKQRGEEIKEATLQSLLKDFNGEEFAKEKKYSLSDLKTSSQNDEKFLRAYGNAMGSVFARYANTQDYPYDEVEIFREALEEGNFSGLPKLEFVSVVYQNIVTDLLAITAPMSAAENHLALVNGYFMLSKTTDAMRFLLQDPLRSGLAYETYVGQTAINQASFFNMVIYFQNKKIIFEKEEAGWLFNMSAE